MQVEKMHIQRSCHPHPFFISDIAFQAVGFGTFQGDDGNGNAKGAVRLHMDTATAYGNEREVGKAIKESGIPREEIIVITKLAQTWHCVSDPIIDYGMLRDCPSTWTAMEILIKKGKARTIGVSNFNILKLKKLLEYLPQVELVDFCRIKGIHVVAHQPLGGKPVAAVIPNADRPAQTILSWIVQQNISVIPQTVQERRMVENLDLKQLPTEDMAAISNISKKKGEVRYLDPKHHIGFDIFDEQHDQPVQE
ncbi:aldo/keto reductase [Aspergillus vadensis CBS 113365]|uniref:D-xylose reductase [NAD(P)H] n=1 Tax=Aspergillus vadensis (strain CBS 113365 / IMI 142717 / IBT 24658) TaxID=1448311 RepID=A0A319BUN5_ASPVC|nr:Aldo/keto reductase [Aspergillus vadensis CBS 113365]PYH69573.1 Aldo/keto reductase [Aspergillus vadensis CBS 113365]